MEFVEHKILKIIAKTGGIQFEGSNKWINPSKEAKNNILENIEKIKELKNKKVMVTMKDENTFSGIALDPISKAQMVEKETKRDQEKKSILDPKHIIRLQGKDFVTHAGLLEVAHKIGLKSISTDLIHREKDLVIMKAKAIMNNGNIFEAYGDASPTNVNRMILPHMIRMAETRAVNRALRFATNIGMCSIEELGEEKKEEKSKAVKKAEELFKTAKEIN